MGLRDNRTTGVVAAPLSREFSGTRGRPRFNWTAAAMIGPAVLALLLIGIYPLIQAVSTSFKLYQITKPYLGTPWVGLDNYQTVLKDSLFWSALGRTGLFFLLTV
ncbi:MAG: hypothetical protein M3Q71_12360, partial [Chloroflexota bacterium]|nr:hypothetical protein [Chloroflexota bacterium]